MDGSKMETAVANAYTALEHALRQLGTSNMATLAADAIADLTRQLAEARAALGLAKPHIVAAVADKISGSAKSLAALDAAPSGTSDPRAEARREAFQARVQPWMMACFGPEISGDRVERGDRLLEEVFELLQSGGYDPARVVSLRDYVWGREVGEPYQEVGGVMVTLAAYCLAHDLDMHGAGETELARIWTKVEKIRAKQAAKPKHSPLPVAASDMPAPDTVANAGQIKLRFFRDLIGAERIKVYQVFGAWPENGFDGTLTHGIEYHLFRAMLAAARKGDA